MRGVCSQNLYSTHVIKLFYQPNILIVYLSKINSDYYYSFINEIQIYDGKSCILIFFINQHGNVGMHEKIMDNGLMAADLKSMEGKLYLFDFITAIL